VTQEDGDTGGPTEARMDTPLQPSLPETLSTQCQVLCMCGLPTQDPGLHTGDFTIHHAERLCSFRTVTKFTNMTAAVPGLREF
jgi:hypothetical protein